MTARVYLRSRRHHGHAGAHFGTDGVRGVVGEDLTVELVERLGRAATLWSGRGRVFVGRDTRGSGPELEEAFARGVVAAGGNAVLAGVLPTPAVALLALDLGVVISASHNPPEYNGVKFFDARRAQADRRVRGGDRGAARRARRRAAARSTASTSPPTATSSTSLERFGTDLSGLRIAVDCANGAYSDIAPAGVRAARRRGDGDRRSSPTATNINVGLRRDRPGAAAGHGRARRLRPRRRLRRRRRPHARGGRRRQRRRRRPDPRDPRARTSASTSSP